MVFTDTVISKVVVSFKQIIMPLLSSNYLKDLLNFDDPLNVEASELYFKNKVKIRNNYVSSIIIITVSLV